MGPQLDGTNRGATWRFAVPTVRLHVGRREGEGCGDGQRGENMTWSYPRLGVILNEIKIKLHSWLMASRATQGCYSPSCQRISILSGLDRGLPLLLKRGPGRDRHGERVRRGLPRADRLHRGRAGVRQIRFRPQCRRRRTDTRRLPEVR